MRIALSIIFCVLVALLGLCAFFAFRSKKKIGKSVALMIISLVPPVIGNLLLIAAPIKELSEAGCYIYFLGMDLVILAVFRFMFDYCDIHWHEKVIKWVVYVVLILDAIQVLLNIAFGHAFTMILEPNGFYNFVAVKGFSGQLVHRLVDYVILGSVMLVFLLKTIFSSKVYAEKYFVILLAMVAVAIWQSVNIFTSAEINFSMIGYGVFGLLVFFLSLYYRPLRLLDRMLGVIASEMSESIFFFDTNGRCIWANQKAFQLLKIEDGSLDNITDLLNEKLGAFEKEGSEWENTLTFGYGDTVKSYVIQKHNITDDRQRIVGYYMNIRDNSELSRETFNANHDPLTKIYNRAGYDSAMDSLDLAKVFLVLIDLDSFKEANDKYGHTAGDKVLLRMVETTKKHFREEDYVCRLGGDEFAVIISNVTTDISKDVEKRIKAINDELSTPIDDLPGITVSSGGAYGKDAENAYELFNNADHAMYHTKFSGKCGFSLYEKR